MHAAAEDGDARLHRVPQERGGGCEFEPRCRVFCVSAQPDGGWFFYQQDWDSVFGLYREWLFGGVSRVSPGSRGLKSSQQTDQRVTYSRLRDFSFPNFY